MKKKYKYLFLLLITLCFFITGCGGNEKVEPNQNVGDLKYYVPTDFKSREDLRGLIYNDNTRKIFAKGDTDDYNTFMYIDVIKGSTMDLDAYINKVNTENLRETDVKFIKQNSDSLNIYGREGYETKKGNVNIINYAYITVISNSSYTITISGASAKKQEVNDLAKKVLSSFQK